MSSKIGEDSNIKMIGLEMGTGVSVCVWLFCLKCDELVSLPNVSWDRHHPCGPIQGKKRVN